MEREPKNERVGRGRGRKEGNKRRARMYLGNTKFNFTSNVFHTQEKLETVVGKNVWMVNKRLKMVNVFNISVWRIK